MSVTNEMIDVTLLLAFAFFVLACIALEVHWSRDDR